MSGVDVLKVLEHFADHGATSRDRINAERGRAAVAELIEAAVEYLESGDARGRLKAALIRVKGESE